MSNIGKQNDQLFILVRANSAGGPPIGCRGLPTGRLLPVGGGGGQPWGREHRQVTEITNAWTWLAR